jgi:hypothetical protein
MKQSRKSKKSKNNNDDKSLSKNSFTFRKRTEIDIIEPSRFPNALRTFN